MKFPPPEQRFWASVHKADPDECWPWVGGLTSTGYGRLRVGSKQIKAPRYSLLLAGVEIPPAMDVLHRCNNPACVNPAHLYIGTDVDNARDRMLAGTVPLGEKNPMAKLRAIDVRNIRKLYASNKHLSKKDRRRFTMTRLAAIYGVSLFPIKSIIHGKTWKHVA